MFSINKLTKKRLPKSFLHYKKIKERILGKKFNLSLVFIENAKAKKLNKEFRKKNKPANVLSFPLEKTCGEIFINIETKKEAPKFEMNFSTYIDYLLIHGALHLSGLDHGEKMEKLEEKFLGTYSHTK
jgi:probable rRNA maturation factor